jgi:hypothetical protein
MGLVPAYRFVWSSQSAIWYSCTCLLPATLTLKKLTGHHAPNISCYAKRRKWSYARRALATLVAQLFSCPDGEHCFIRERAHWQLFCCGNRKVAACCGLTPSRGNRNFAGNDRTHMFQSVRAHWQLNSCLLAAVRCANLVSCVIRLCLSSKT